MKKVEMPIELAKQMLKTADQGLKAQILEACPELNQSIIDRIKSVDCAVQELGEDDADVRTYKTMLTAGIVGHALNYQRLVVIAKALNEGWTPNWNDGLEAKHYPYFDMEDGFSCLDYGYYYVHCSRVGSRLCYRNSDLARYAGTQFLDIYKTVFTL